MEKEQTSRLLTLIAGAFPEVVSTGEVAIASWQIALADLDYSAAEKATVMVLQRAKYRPRPSDIREAVSAMKPKTIPTAEDAWEEVLKQLNPYQAPKWSHPLVQRAVRIMGFENLMHSNYPGRDREQFIKIYSTLVQRGETEIAVGNANNAVGLISIRDIMKSLGAAK